MQKSTHPRASSSLSPPCRSLFRHGLLDFAGDLVFLRLSRPPRRSRLSPQVDPVEPIIAPPLWTSGPLTPDCRVHVFEGRHKGRFRHRLVPVVLSPVHIFTEKRIP